MAVSAIEMLTALALILFAGLVVSVIANKIKISNILLLIIVGLIGKYVLGYFLVDFEIPATFMVSVSLLTLVMVVFEGSSGFKLRVVDKMSAAALKVTMYFLLINSFFLTIFTEILFFKGAFAVSSLLFGALFAVIMTGTDPGSVFVMLKSKSNKVIEFLEVESILNTPFMVIFPFLVLDIVMSANLSNVASAVAGQVIPFLQQIIVGVGTGVLMSIIMLKAAKKASSQYLGVGLITAALLTYILSEALSGSGVLGVATLGLMFGNSYVKEKETFKEFNSMLNNSLIILVFVLIGLVIDVNFSFSLLFKAFLLFIALILCRLTAIWFALEKEDFNTKEKFFIALSMPKGIAAAVVTFSLSMIPLPVQYELMLSIVLELIIVMMIYSLVLSSIIDRYSKWFIRIKLEAGK